MTAFAPRFRAAIFDLDGTLIDSERLMVDAAVTTLVGLGFPPRRDLLVDMVGAVDAPGYPTLAAIFGPDFDATVFSAMWDSEIRRLFGADLPRRPGARRLLQILTDRDLPIALATNSTSQSADRKLRASGIDRFFAPGTVFGRNTVARPKPHPEMFLAAADALGHAAEHCLVFEDSDVGVAAALAAGMAVVQIPDQRPAGTNDATLIAASLLDGAQQMGLIPR